MPFYSRGCYVSIQDRGNVKAVLQVPLTLTLTLTLSLFLSLTPNPTQEYAKAMPNPNPSPNPKQEYAEAMLPKKADGSYDCQCIVFSDGGRILGLGDRARARVRVRVRHPRAG